MDVIYCTVRGDDVVWLERNEGEELSCLRGMELEEGGEVRHFLDVYDELRGRSEAWWSLLDSGDLRDIQEGVSQVLRGEWAKVMYRSIRPLMSRGKTLPWSKAARAVRECAADTPHLTILLDIRSRTLGISTGWDLAQTDLTLPMDADRTVVEAIRENGVAVGFGLGTDEAGLQRDFLPPWRQIAKCLASPDPIQSLRAAARADTLRDRLHVQAGRHYAISDAGYMHPGRNREEDGDRLIKLHIPGIFLGKGAGALPFLCRVDGSVELYLPSFRRNPDLGMPFVALKIESASGGKDAVTDLARTVDRDRSGSLLQSLRDLAWAVLLKDMMVGGYFTAAERERNTVLRYYAQSRLPEDIRLQGLALPGTMLPLRWCELEEWVGWDESAGRQTPCFLHCRLRSDTDVEEDILFCEPDRLGNPSRNWTVCPQTKLAEVMDSVLLASIREPDGRLDRNRFWKGMRDRIGDMVLAGQKVCVIDPMQPGRIAYGGLARDGDRFIVFLGGAEKPLSDILEAGKNIYTSTRQIKDELSRLGRSMLDFGELLQEREYMNKRVRKAIQTLLDSIETVSGLRNYTLPSGWASVVAQFQDGAIGVAYGPGRQENIYRTAAQRPSQEALLLLE